MKFLIDECLSPALVSVAHDHGFEAYHVAHRGWSGLKDPQLLQQLVENELILVTNNREDFLSLMSGVELHPGLVVVLDTVRRQQQVELLTAVLEALRPRRSMINKVAEVASDGKVSIYDLPAI